MVIEDNNDKTKSETAPTESSHIGADEWVAQIEERQQARTGFWGTVANRWETTPISGRYAFVIILLLIAPLVTATEPALNLLGISDNAFLVRTATRFLNFALLAIGLNVVVGYAGLFDLGYIAFAGIAGYSYAYLSSEFVKIGDIIPNGLAIPAIISIPLIIALTALIGWLIGSVSIRLAGDYLAIVTLGFGQVFLQLALTATRVKFPWAERSVDLTRGPNGINNLDDISLFGYTFESSLQYYYLFFALLVIVYIVVYRLNKSRVGRSWRAIRDDELAAEVMGIPTRHLKLLAFAIGAAIAALAGSVEAAWQGNVLPNPRYSVLTLITLYAMVVLGGTGSLPGAVLGAFIFTVIPEALRSILVAGILFYSAGFIGLYITLKPFKRFATLMVSTIVAGYLLKLIINLFWPGLDSGFPEAGSVLNQAVQGWLVIPEAFKLVGNIVTGGAVIMLLLTILVKSRFRWVMLGLTVYMFAFAWETRLAVEPAATRILIVGATLVTLMIVRPQGLLGKTEVKVV